MKTLMTHPSTPSSTPPLIHCRRLLVTDSSQYSLTHPPLLLLLLVPDISAMAPSCRLFLARRSVSTKAVTEGARAGVRRRGDGVFRGEYGSTEPPGFRGSAEPPVLGLLINPLIPANHAEILGCANSTVICVVILLVPTVVLRECTCDTEDEDRNKSQALKLKFAVIASILVTGAIGVCLPMLGKAIPALSPEKNIFFIIKTFAAGGYIGNWVHSRTS
ncbi:hypothetical protein Q3G72_016848 [Acer saccharum]|nr:hypothetical protein Q3G72_016848 [Acer saccharum]